MTSDNELRVLLLPNEDHMECLDELARRHGMAVHDGHNLILTRTACEEEDDLNRVCYTVTAVDRNEIVWLMHNMAINPHAYESPDSSTASAEIDIYLVQWDVPGQVLDPDTGKYEFYGAYWSERDKNNLWQYVDWQHPDKVSVCPYGSLWANELIYVIGIPEYCRSA